MAFCVGGFARLFIVLALFLGFSVDALASRRPEEALAQCEKAMNLDRSNGGYQNLKYTKSCVLNMYYTESALDNDGDF